MKISQIQTYTGHKGSIFSICIDQAENTLYSAGDDGIVAAWTLDTINANGKGILSVDHALYSMCLIPDKSWLAIGSSQGWVYIVNLANKQLVHQYRAGELPIYGLAYQQTSNQLWILHAQGKLELISLDTFEHIFSHRLSKSHLRSIVFDLPRDQVYIGASDNQIYVLNPTGDQILQQWEAHANSVFCLAIHPKGNLLVSGGRDAHIKAWDIDQGFTEVHSIPAHNFTVNAISFAGIHPYFATASRDKTVKIWDMDQFKLLKVFDPIRNDGHKHSVNKVVWHADGSLLSASDDRKIIHWRIDT